MADPTSASAFSAAASSSASASTSYPRYDAFISHGGPDCKHGLATRLYDKLCDQGLLVFLDCEELVEGRNITSQLEAAIRGASVHVAILSPGYADSYWCLNELVLMVSSEKTILPVFYNVEPSMVRRATGTYGEALHKLEEKRTREGKPRYHSNTVKSWRDALYHVGNLSGFVLHGDEDELRKSDEVVQSVLKNVPKTPLEVAKYPTGLGDKLQDFERTVLWEQQESKTGGAKIVGIVGLGGIGKTTLAKHFFNINLKRLDYKSSSFLSDVREHARTRSLNNLQSKLLFDLIPDLKDKGIKIDSPDQGLGILKRHLQSCHALIILDDVDDMDQMEAFLPISDIIDPKSLILITSRDKQVLRSSGVLDESIYNLRGLNMSGSKELFCSYAFFHRHPLPEFEDLVNRFVKACDGLPLSLRIFGALVCQRKQSYWEERLEQLQKRLHTKIQERLGISYESLEEQDQEIFLDIVCFFIGEKLDLAIRIWGVVGLENLESKCLLEVDTEKRIKMHDHIRDMGRSIAKEASMPRRLSETDDFLEQTSSGITEVRGISMVYPIWRTRSHLKDPKWELFNKDHYDCMNLKFLATEGDYLEAILRGVSSAPLIWLRWYGCPDHYLPSSVPMENLRVLEVSGSRLEMLWQLESQSPLHLRELYIDSHCFSEFPKSIGELEYLEKIDVGREWNTLPLKRLPEEFGHLHRLKWLTLRGCSRMMSLPDSFGSLTNLQHLCLLEASSLKTLPNSVGNLISLQHFELTYASSLEKLPNSFGKLTSLQHISLSGASSLKTLPNSFGSLTGVQHLYLSGASSMKTLPVFKCDERELERLKEGGALKKLDCKDNCMFGLQHLVLREVNISEVAFHEGVCSNLQYLALLWCKELRQIGDLSGAEKLRTLEIKGCENLEELPSLETLICLRALAVSDCPKLKSIQGLGHLTKLRRIRIWKCAELREVPGVKYSYEWNRFEGFISSCLTYVDGLGPEMRVDDGLTEVSDELADVSIIDCPKLQTAEDDISEEEDDTSMCLIC